MASSRDAGAVGRRSRVAPPRPTPWVPRPQGGGGGRESGPRTVRPTGKPPPCLLEAGRFGPPGSHPGPVPARRGGAAARHSRRQEELASGRAVDVRFRFRGGPEQPPLMAAGLAGACLLAALAAGALRAPAWGGECAVESGQPGTDRKRD